MICGPLLQLLGVAAGILDVQMAELASHDSLLFRNGLEANVKKHAVFRSGGPIEAKVRIWSCFHWRAIRSILFYAAFFYGEPGPLRRKML
ncbi:MAG: hypothetical protein ABW003_12470 [Microvirga sp.]